MLCPEITPNFFRLCRCTNGEGGPPRRNANANPLVGSHCVFSRLHTPNLQPTHFQQITHSGGWGGYPCRPPRIDRRHESNPCVFKPLCNTPPPIAFVFKGLRNYEREGGYSSTFNENRCRFYGREKREHGAKQLLFFTTPTRPATSGRARPRAGTGAPLWPAPRWHTRRKRGIRL